MILFSSTSAVPGPARPRRIFAGRLRFGAVALLIWFHLSFLPVSSPRPSLEQVW